MELTIKKLVVIILAILGAVILIFVIGQVKEKGLGIIDFSREKAGSASMFFPLIYFRKPVSKHLNNRIIINNKLLDRGGMNEQ